MDRIFLNVNAKINLSLDVVGRIENAYHALDMCLASINLCDEIDVALNSAISVTMDGKISGIENIAYKTAVECVKAGIVKGLDINIIKGIPMSSGMGGSSADCAGVLFAVQKLTNCEHSQMLKIARKLASDAVFMYHGGIAHATGKGDDLQFLPFKKLYFTIAKNAYGALTKDVFNQFDNGNAVTTRYTPKCIDSLGSDDILVGNGLTCAASVVNVGIRNTIEILKKHSDKVCMTGSGSACFAVWNSLQEAENCRKAIGKYVDFSAVATTCESGIEEIKQ